MIQSSKDYRSGGSRDWLNPYLVAASLVLKRLMWDLQPSAWMYRRKLSLLREKHLGKKAIILCNGPSLNSAQLHKD